MKRFSLIQSLAVLLSALLLSCSKEPNLNFQSKIVSPNINAQYRYGEKVDLLGKISTSGKIKKINIQIKNLTSNEVVFVKNYFARNFGKGVFNIAESWTNNVLNDSKMRLHIRAYACNENNDEDGEHHDDDYNHDNDDNDEYYSDDDSNCNCSSNHDDDGEHHDDEVENNCEQYELEIDFDCFDNDDSNS